MEPRRRDCLESLPVGVRIGHSSSPRDRSTSAFAEDPCAVAKQETYEGRKALDSHADRAKLGNGVEGGSCGTSAKDHNSDADGIMDGTERGWCTDTGHDGKINAVDLDSDNDGIADGTEDANKNGVVDTAELDGLNPDTDDDTDADGLNDYTELHGTWCHAGETSGCGSDTSARYPGAAAKGMPRERARGRAARRPPRHSGQGPHVR